LTSRLEDFLNLAIASHRKFLPCACAFAAGAALRSLGFFFEDANGWGLFHPFIATGFA